MTTVILNDVNSELTFNDGILAITHPSLGHRTLPLNIIDTVLIGRAVKLSSSVILALAERNIPLFFISSKNTVAATYPLHEPTSNIRLKQYALVSHPIAREKWARKLVEARIRSQKNVLKNLQLSVPTRKTSASRESWDNLMLYEAQFSRLYWNSLAALLEPWGFITRIRRPPPDPVNALLSLTATLEDSLLAKALLGVGLDISLGLHHETGYRRQSLLLDIKELTRAKIEYWVIQLFLTKQFDNADFIIEGEQCRLTSLAQQRFYPLWYQFSQTRTTELKQLAEYCARSILRGKYVLQATLAI